MKFLRELIFVSFSRFLAKFDAFRVERTVRRLQSCGERLFLSPTCIILSPSQVRIGSDVTINPYTHIFAGGGVTIGDGTMISALCSITSVTHPKDSPYRAASQQVWSPVVIGRNVWIGTGAIILPGVTIGDHAIIGAGAVVTKDVPPRTVYAGNPARLLSELNIQEEPPPAA